MVLYIKNWAANILHFIDEMEKKILFFTDFQMDWMKVCRCLTFDSF